VYDIVKEKGAYPFPGPVSSMPKYHVHTSDQKLIASRRCGEDEQEFASVPKAFKFDKQIWNLKISAVYRFM
jgi:hypothetical protein